mmetsp:Transcript_1477/g.2194  ORF Transcript_1477/g.2194 Transcript_1477/m.2194 type:complete len:140 (-) Transcript_1477:118-537(-)
MITIITIGPATPITAMQQQWGERRRSNKHCKIGQVDLPNPSRWKGGRRGGTTTMVSDPSLILFIIEIVTSCHMHGLLICMVSMSCCHYCYDDCRTEHLNEVSMKACEFQSDNYKLHCVGFTCCLENCMVCAFKWQSARG